MRISDWSSDVCSSDLARHQIVVEPYVGQRIGFAHPFGNGDAVEQIGRPISRKWPACEVEVVTRQAHHRRHEHQIRETQPSEQIRPAAQLQDLLQTCEQASSLGTLSIGQRSLRSEEQTSELQSLMRISYAVFCLKKKTTG